MTDYWTTQAGRIYDVLTLQCESSDAILEGSSVKFGTTSADKIVVSPSAATGDGVGIALKAASASGETIPVLFNGVHKCCLTSTLNAPTAGDIMINSVTTTFCKTVGSPANTIGMALQSGTVGDYILVLVGRTD